MAPAIFPLISYVFTGFSKLIPACNASLFTGGEVGDGASSAGAIDTGGSGSIFDTIEGLLLEVLQLMGFIAVLVIIIGAIMLIAGLGSDDSRDRMRKILIYTFVGIAFIAFSSAIVTFIYQI